MGFNTALALVKELEGGIEKGVAQDPTTYFGITLPLWSATGHKGPVTLATPQEVAEVYSELWRQIKVHDPESGSIRPLFDMIPEPADAMAFQWFINTTPAHFTTGFQSALLVVPDAVLGPSTLYALGHYKGNDLALRLAAVQIYHYSIHDPSLLKGLVNRVERARKILGV